jgi:ABC-type glycerol-3-phosphate transport system substrate-binding protein
VNGGDACAHCGAALGPGQEYCVECGRRQLPRRTPVHWLFPVAAAALVAAAGAAGAVAAGADDPGSSTIVALTPLRPAASPAVRPSPKLRSWPARRNGYTVVLAVVPGTAGPDAARTRALAAVAAGAPDVGVLASSRYSSLHPGYRLVFSGVYRTLDEALAALPRAARHARSAYAQQITR